MIQQRRNTAGFTLIEVLLALVVLGILAAVAIPSYRSVVNKLRIDQAIIDIAHIETLIESFRSNNFQLPPNLAVLGPSVPTDPWGNAYRYLNIEAGVPRGMVRKDKNLNPLNSDYDLYSMGADGASRLPLTAADSRDDIVRAGNGGFIGLAKDH